MNAFILTIILTTANGAPVTPQPTPISYKSMHACTDELIATYATPMKKYRIVSAKCEKK